MGTVKDAVKKQFAPVTTETYRSWVDFRKERPVTAAVLTEMFENPKKMFLLLRTEFTESDMVKLTPYTLYEKPRSRPFGRITDSKVSENR